MANEIPEVDIEDVEEPEVPEIPTRPETPTTEPPRQKEPETPEARKARLERQLKKVNKELGLDSEPTAPTEPSKPSSDLDYGQKAFLNTYGVKGSDELQLVRDFMKRTGDDLDTIVSDDIFQAKLGKLREAKAAADAVPKSTNRSQPSTHNDVDYWSGKIESGQATLQDIPDVSVRREVLNKRIAHEKTGNQFSDQSVQMG